jgi:hypothetical protein
MASLFVSYSSQDAQIKAELVRRLRDEGFTALFVDLDPESGILAGQAWERELYARMRQADGVVFLASPASLASQWCAIEVGLARSTSKPIFPILVAGTRRHPLLEDVQWVDLTSEGGIATVDSSLVCAGPVSIPLTPLPGIPRARHTPV